MQKCQTDFLIIGGGVIGLSIARELKAKFPAKKITLIEKEPHTGEHASGRNSGVLHAGFYYTADSLKAKFCRDGNRLLREYIEKRGLPFNPCTKVVVAKDEAEHAMLYELKSRGDVNGVDVSIVDEKRLAEIEPNAKTHKEAIYSPSTATTNPFAVCQSMTAELAELGIEFLYNTPYQERISENTIHAGDMEITAQKIINCAGVYADRIARDFGFCRDYTIIPFKGVYVKYTGPDVPIKTCIYPVPDMKNPFLGVHYGVYVDGTVKIGPTAIPAFWRENYHGLENFSLRDVAEITGWETFMFLTNPPFRNLAIREAKKYSITYMASEAAKLVKHIDQKYFNQWSRPGIRAQLVDKRTNELAQDFIIEGDAHSAHVLNAVSPAFTCSLAFAKWAVEKYI